MTILVLGATGMLGRVLVDEARRRGLDAVGAARRGADIALDLADGRAVRETLARVRPDVVINAAALIDHGECEAHPDAAYAINARAVASARSSTCKRMRSRRRSMRARCSCSVLSGCSHVRGTRANDL